MSTCNLMFYEIFAWTEKKKFIHYIISAIFGVVNVVAVAGSDQCHPHFGHACNFPKNLCKCVKKKNHVVVNSFQSVSSVKLTLKLCICVVGRVCEVPMI
jgi:hypothetical protein